jgi:hypothetical protein
VEYLVRSFQPQTLADWPVLQSIAVIWRIRATGLTRRHRVALVHDSEVLGDGGTDECHCSTLWYHDGWIVGVGTEDAEGLAAQTAPSLQARLTQDASCGCRFLWNGLAVTLPELAPEEEIEGHFIVAWCPGEGGDAQPVYWAIDMTHMALRRALGVSTEASAGA